MLCFEYKEVRYKLIQSNEEEGLRDVLLTIIDDVQNVDSESRAYNMAAEFLSAIAWKNCSKIIFEYERGMGIPEDYKLEHAKRRQASPSEIPYSSQGHDILQIPKIENSDQKSALALFREALGSNNKFLSFLFFWQILEIGSGGPVGWVNKTYRKKDTIGFYLNPNDLHELRLGAKSLGDYLHDDCRNAIAHIKRKKGERELKLDTLEDARRIKVSVRIVEAFAKFYIINELRLKNKFHLAKRSKEDHFLIYT
jgi:hypothetical protein